MERSPAHRLAAHLVRNAKADRLVDAIDREERGVDLERRELLTGESATRGMSPTDPARLMSSLMRPVKKRSDARRLRGK